jgi:predicted HicB family RNase H-like nuclease
MEKERNKGRVILLRLRDDEDKKALEQKAKEARMSLNGYIVHVLNQSGVFAKDEHA